MTFAYQRWKAEESQARIISALSEGGKTFTELLEATGLSKPVLAQHLKTLDQKKVTIVPRPETKSFLYTLVEEGLSDKDRAYTIFSRIKRVMVERLEKAASDKEISDEDYLKLFEEGLKTLALFQLILAYYISPEYGREYIEGTYGHEFRMKLSYLLPWERLESLSKIIEAKSPKGADLINRMDAEDFSRILEEHLKKHAESNQ